MIIKGYEYQRLVQLTDSEHTLSVIPTSLETWTLLPLKSNDWAVREVQDWRVQHPLECRCIPTAIRERFA